MTCNVNEETINVTWKKDGDSVPERAKIDTRLDDEKSTFAITGVVKEDSGVYSCEARNKLGFVARSFVKINVKGKLVLPSCLKKKQLYRLKNTFPNRLKLFFN